MVPTLNKYCNIVHIGILVGLVFYPTDLTSFAVRLLSPKKAGKYDFVNSTRRSQRMDTDF